MFGCCNRATASASARKRAHSAGWEHCPAASILRATVLGVSQKTVQRRLHEARLLLAERLADLRPPTPPGDTPPT